MDHLFAVVVVKRPRHRQDNIPDFWEPCQSLHEPWCETRRDGLELLPGDSVGGRQGYLQFTESARGASYYGIVHLGVILVRSQLVNLPGQPQQLELCACRETARLPTNLRRSHQHVIEHFSYALLHSPSSSGNSLSTE